MDYKKKTLVNLRNTFSQITAIKQVLLYGSRAKGDFSEGSDIDIVLIGENLNLDNSVYPLMDQIEELYLPYTFDISIFSEIENEALLEHITTCGITLYLKNNS